MRLLALSYIKLAIAGVILSSLGLLGYKLYNIGFTSGKQEIQSAWDKQIILNANAVVVALQAEQLKQAQLQSKLDIERKEHEKIVKANIIKYSAIISSLSDRPSTTTISESTKDYTPLTNRQFCDGSQLYREYATDLAGEAYFATRLKNELKSCVDQYNFVRDSINSE